MTGLYLFAAAAGVPLVAWFLLSGGDEGGEGGGDDGIGGVMLRLLPLSTIALAVAIFGICGLVLGAVGTSSGTTLAASAAVAVLAGALNSTAFGYLRRSESSASVDDERLAGHLARVVLPVGTARRGRIALTVGGQDLYLSAESVADPDADDQLEPGTTVLVVEVRNGVAGVVRADPELLS